MRVSSSGETSHERVVCIALLVDERLLVFGWMRFAIVACSTLKPCLMGDARLTEEFARLARDLVVLVVEQAPCLRGMHED